MFKYYNPVKIHFGENAILSLENFLDNRKALLLTSNGFVKRGIVEKISNESKLIVEIISNVEPNPTLNYVLNLYNQLDFSKFDVIIALGGGSVIDVAKAISVHGPMISSEVLEDIIKAKQVNLENIRYKPIIAIPTTSGTASEVTPWGTIWDVADKKKYSIYTEKLWCEVAVCDPLLTLSLPMELTIHTGLDALSHSLEALWNRNANPISTMYAIEAAREIIDTLPKVIKDMDNHELRNKMMLGSLKDGLAFSNTQTSIAHAISYYFTLHKDIPHGIAASITLPDIIGVAVEKNIALPHLKEILGEFPTKRVIQFFQEINISVDYKDYRIKLEDFSLIKESLKDTPRINNSLIHYDDLFDRVKLSMNV